MDSSDSELDFGSVRKTYFITYSRADLKRFPTRESFGKCVVEAFSLGKSKSRLLHWVCSQEEHKDGKKHYHVALKFDSNVRWKAAKMHLYHNKGISVHFSDKHYGYYAAYHYAVKHDEEPFLSQNHPNLSNAKSPKTKICSQALHRSTSLKRQSVPHESEPTPSTSGISSSQGSKKMRRLSNFELNSQNARKTKSEEKVLWQQVHKKEEIDSTGTSAEPIDGNTVSNSGLISSSNNDDSDEEDMVLDPDTRNFETPRSSRQSIPASVRKLAKSPDEEGNNTSSSEVDSDEEASLATSGFRLMDLSMLFPVIEMLLCPSCKGNGIVLQEVANSKMGFASSIDVRCSMRNCQFSTQFYTSKRTGHSFEINKRAVLASRNIGVGHEGLVKFAAAMNMPPSMNANAYTDSVKHLKEAAKDVAERSMHTAASETKRSYEVADDGIYDIGVSGDGTWRKRGFTSSSGIVTAMSIVTGKVLDTEIMSKECRTCIINNWKKGTPEFDQWWERHKEECHTNFHGSSGKMDPVGCNNIFKRSIDKHSLRYTEFLGDGDSKAHKELTAEKVYGDIPVTKLECVGHIQKRMGTRLRSLKSRSGNAKLSDGKSIGGRGRLTNKLIDSLQVYYGKAIMGNTESIIAMKDAVMAIWHHIQSTDEDPNHNLCPKGSSSWCGFQRDVSNGTSTYRHEHPLPVAVADEIRPTFEALSAELLLSACLHGGTQNQNEAFNALIWQRAPKETHASLPTVEIATYLAIGIFNDGANTIMDVLEKLGLEPGLHCKAACEKIDRKRLFFAKVKSTEKAKARRRAIRNRKKGFSDALEDTEGLQYKSGAF
eukprot:Seg314.3 transcript_id=Seg314.3/GoldUCD/mRNA.D3Y31 product="hypothetical protein" protein_id=Seg314.3/GoldUCD/D3Y31